MKRKTFSILIALVAAVSFGLVITLPVMATTPLERLNALGEGADRLAGTQNYDGGWDWPLDDYDPYTGSAPNTIGPIAMGLAQAYLYTEDVDHYAVLEEAGAFLLTKDNNFSPPDGYLAAQLDTVFGVTTYRDHVKENFYDKLAAGTYDRNGAGALYDTTGYVDWIRTARANQGVPNLAAWDIGMGLVGASSIGASTSEWIAGVKAEINELDGNEYYDIIGLAGAVYGLAFVGEDFDPTSGEHAAAENLSDLTDILAGYQIEGGGFTWNSNYISINEGNETIQETSYAILALNEIDSTAYLNSIRGAVDYLMNVQLSSGGWENYVGSRSGENNELTAEALWAISIPCEICIDLEKAKVSWDHNDIHLHGKLYLPEGFWVDNLNPVGSAVITLAGEEIANQSVEFEIKGKKGDKWEYKDKKNQYGNIKEFKVDWKEAKFDYHGDDGFHIHTHSIGGTETTLCIHTGHVSGAFTVTIDETTIAYDEDRNITTDVPYEAQKKDNSHVHFSLAFQLTSDMTIEVSGAVELTIDVADYYKEGRAKFKVKAIFDPADFLDGSDSLPDELEYVISLGDDDPPVSGSDLIGVKKIWTKKDTKHWEYKYK
jgi:hypothetical protein